MKILLTTLNAKYIHSSLALAYLQAYCQDYHDIHIREYTINEPADKIRADIYSGQPDIVCFSCYIWNIELIKIICADLKQVLPGIKIIVGGPEVSYDADRFMDENPTIDYVICGEGEVTLLELLNNIKGGGTPEKIAGIAYRQGSIAVNQERPLIQDLDSIPFPYENKLTFYNKRIIYYEASRGCPFNCSYCLSSTVKGVRYFSLGRVKKDLQYLMDSRVPKVKFVDRTFNAGEKRARSIMEFIVAHNQVTNFHCEIDAAILTPEMLSFLEKLPAGMFDFEIGVQSTFPPALAAVNRSSSWEKQRYNIARLLKSGNIHIHLDLIAGLPWETYEQFGKSFNDVYCLTPDIIQLGFLKLLKGSPLRQQHREYDYRFEIKPPYQVLGNQFISYSEMLKLGQIENLLNRYYNTGIADNFLSSIISRDYQGNPFVFYESLASYLHSRDFFRYGQGRIEEYKVLYRFVNDCRQENLLYTELLKYDFLLNNRERSLPSFFVSHNPDHAGNILYSLIKDPDFIAKHVPEFKGKAAREIRRLVHLEYMMLDASYQLADEPVPILFIYESPGHKARTLGIDQEYLID